MEATELGWLVVAFLLIVFGVAIALLMGGVK
jgi:hypothetical protein